MMHGPINLRFTNAKEAKIVHEYKNIRAVNSEIIKQVTSVGLSLFNYEDDARSNKLKIHKCQRGKNHA